VDFVGKRETRINGVSYSGKHRKPISHNSLKRQKRHSERELKTHKSLVRRSNVKALKVDDRGAGKEG